MIVNKNNIINLDVFNSSNTAQGSDRAYSGVFSVLNADIDAINQVEATGINPVDNADVSTLAGSDNAQSFDQESGALVKEVRQRVSGILLRAVVLQVVIITIWLPV